MQRNRRSGAFRIEDVSSQSWSEFRRRYGLLTLSGVIVTCGILWLMVYMRQIAIETGQDFDPGVFGLATLFLLPGFYWFNSIKAKNRKEFMDQIPRALRLTRGTDLDFVEHSRAHIFEGTGTANMIRDMFTGSHNDATVRLYTHDKTVGSGDGSTTYTSTVYDLSYPHPLPHMLINFGRERPEGTEPIEFDTKYKAMRVRAEIGKEREVRAILRPELIQKMFDGLHGTKIEIVTEEKGAMIYYYADCNDITNMSELMSFVDSGNEFYDLLIEGLKK